ncbi:mate-domain-containing protein [Cercophora newfieldiana]|uniref:Mate-domain-containing protein n=1 Tax=Cercophora newfieldiana TaxID=92897 RepID=A0AA39YC93_9PEZI|nr:mate-domain-containing protein [Cercophora newfieldiana]
MAETPALTITQADDRRGSVLSALLPESLTLPPLFLSTSPIAREILQNDIDEQIADEPLPSDSDSDSDTDVASEPPAADDAKLAFHGPTGVVYGCGFSSIPLPGVDRPVPNPREIEESLQAEVSLLRDNGVLPPKQRHGSVVDRVYHHMFNADDIPGHESSLLPADEVTPLLGDVEGDYGAQTPMPKDVHKLWEEAVAAHHLKTTWQREAKTLVGYALPLIVTFLLHYSVTIGSVLAVGRLGMLELGAVNLATMTASITCYVPVQGLATCLDTLCSIAYGSGNKQLVGLQAQRMTVLLWLLMIPIAVVWWFSEPILIALVPEEEIAQMAAAYLRILIIGMPGVAALESAKRFVQSQGLFHITTYALFIGAPVSFLLDWALVFHFGWGFSGAAFAMAITQNLLPLLIAAYVFLFEGSQCWDGLNRKAFRNWGPMIKLALPGMIMVEAQFSVLEILTIAAGQFGPAKFGAQSILVTVTSTSFNIPFPLAIATSTRVANLIGAGLADAAQVTAKVGVVGACIVGTFNLCLFVFLREQIAKVFTPDAEVIAIASQVMLVCACMEIFDALAAVSHGILRGIGRQAIGGYANLFAYYFIALPVGLSTAFALGWELSGLWVGLTAGLAAVSAIELLYLYHANWETAAAQAQSIMRSEDANSELKQHGS